MESQSLLLTRILHIHTPDTLTGAIPIMVTADIRIATTVRMLTHIGVGADTGAVIGDIRGAAITVIADTSADLGVTAIAVDTATEVDTATVAATGIEVDTPTADMAVEDLGREAVVSAAATSVEGLREAAEAGVNFAAR